ncbi:hypothetical protein K6119_00125 [Paracrocinitomix mangrovi]|uniref:hypothetical protein n=1 Tax=Paracrocinitomix mangrovi TaxID=2862509 RepID=UPI001C8DBBBC|nr:hypothetical protein [Paracrocinitomix mangrovi]UKN01921.1 hypothetical protein K6119_00125 [Paracrocinitomix mangrovi]
MRKLLVIIAILSYNFVSAQEKFAEINVKDETDFSEFEVFGDSLDHYRVYFTGENHNFAKFNASLEYKMLTYLHQTQGVKHFIFEQSPGVGYIIEQIIIHDKRSNLSYLKDVFYDPFYYLVKHIREYNDTLDYGDKIHIHGIDVERFPYFSIYALDQIVDTLDGDVEGGEVFEQIHALKTSNYEFGSARDFYADEEDGMIFTFGEVSAWGSLSSIIETSKKYRDSLKKELGPNEDIYYAIIESLEKGREWYITERSGDVRSPIVRERFMRDEFSRIYELYPGAKYYGQFGRCHLHKDSDAKRCYDYYMNSVASRINELDSSLTNKVLVIPIFYSQGKEKYDHDIISSLNFKDTIATEGSAYIIDLAYKEGDHPVVGFYDQLPFVIVSNKEVDEDPEEYNFNWETEVMEFHLGASYGYRYFNGIRKLNGALIDFGANTFTNKMVAYNFAFDVFTIGMGGTRFNFTYLPAISNGGDFDLKGWNFGIGSYFVSGNKWATAGFGVDFGYGQMLLTENLNDSIPNLIQSPEQGNVIIYRNDMVIVDPNAELRLTFPVISLNFKAGYAFDVSGKRWRLDGKMDNFTKTSFTSPYVQAGISLNIKYEY